MTNRQLQDLAKNTKSGRDLKILDWRNKGLWCSRAALCNLEQESSFWSIASVVCLQTACCLEPLRCTRKLKFLARLCPGLYEEEDTCQVATWTVPGPPRVVSGPAIRPGCLLLGVDPLVRGFGQIYLTVKYICPVVLLSVLIFNLLLGDPAAHRPAPRRQCPSVRSCCRK
jgi:hypothetical protein